MTVTPDSPGPALPDQPRLGRVPSGLLVDIDGTLHEAGVPVEGAAEALRRLRGRVPLLFTTNTSRMPRSEVATRLGSLGLDVAPEEVLTATVAAAKWLELEERRAYSYSRRRRSGRICRSSRLRRMRPTSSW